MSSIKEIRDRYKEITSADIMEYEQERIYLYDFIEEYQDDDRSGVTNLVSSARKRVDQIDKEILRVRGMMQFENKYGREYEYICGVDEVGRGPLAGPIVTAAVILPKGLIIPYINDSKQLNEKKRDELCEIIKSVAVDYSIGIRSERDIDDIGIAAADSAAMRDSVLGLERVDMVLVDAFKIPELSIKQVPIIKGDTKSISIAAASIVAKVTRDKMMEELDTKYPGYGFGSNKGYGSAAHIAAIKSLGPCDIHRRSFIGNFISEV